MKINTLLFFLVIGIISFGQQPILEITQEGEDFDYKNIFSELNPEKIPTNILNDKAFPSNQLTQIL